MPVEADAFILKAILNSFEDDAARQILQNVRAAARADDVLLVIERVLDPPNAGPDAKFADLMMFAPAGGRERTAEEFAALLSDSGFALRSIVETRSPVRVIEAVSV